MVKPSNDKGQAQYVRLRQTEPTLAERVFGRTVGYSPFEGLTRDESEARTKPSPLTKGAQYVRLKQEPRTVFEQVFPSAAGYSPFESLTRQETRERTSRSPLMTSAHTVRATGGTPNRITFSSFM